MEKAYLKFLMIIKELKIKTEEYTEALHNYLILSVQSLRLMAGKKNFKDIVKIVKEVE